MSIGAFLQGLFGPEQTEQKTNTGTTAGTNTSEFNIFKDPRFQGFLGSYYDQAGQSGPMNQWQLGGLQGLAGATGYMQPGFAASADIAQNGITGADVNRFYNQNTQNYVNALQTQFNTQNAIQNSQNQAVAARQGALTGSGAGTLRAQTQMAQQTAQNPAIAQAYRDAQWKAQEMAAQSTGQRLQAAGQAPSFVGAAAGAGTQQFGAGNTWWNDPWQRQVGLMGGFQPAITASGQTGNYTGQQQGTQTGHSQQLPSLGGLAAQGIGFLGSMLPFAADGGAIPGYEDGGAVEGFAFGGRPWMSAPNQSGGQPGTNLSAPLGAPMGMPAAGNAMPQLGRPSGAPTPLGKSPPLGPSLAPPPAPVAAPPLGARPPVAPAPPAPSAPPLGAPMGAPVGQPPGATMQTAAVQPQPSMANKWMNMAQGGAVGAAGDGHISGFADKVMHATRMFKEMKRELGGRVEAQSQGQGFEGGGDVWNTTTTPDWGPHSAGWNQPIPGSPEMPTASGGPTDDPRYWDDMRSKAIANDPGMSPRPQGPNVWDKIGQFGRDNTWGPQGRQQGQGAQKDDFAEFMSNLAKTARMGQSQPTMGTRAEGGRVGYEEGGGTFWDTLSDWGGRVGSALTPNLETGMYSGKTTAEGRPSGFQNLMLTLGGVDASKPGFNWAPAAERGLERRFKEMDAERQGNELYEKMTGKQYLPGAGPGGRPTDLPSFAAQKEAGDLAPIYGGKPTPTVHSRATAVQEAAQPYTSYHQWTEALAKDPQFLAAQLAATNDLMSGKDLTTDQIKHLYDLKGLPPRPKFPGAPSGVPDRPAAGPTTGPTAGMPPPTAAAAEAAPAPPVGTPPPTPVAAPAAEPTAAAAPAGMADPSALADEINQNVLGKDPVTARKNWEAIVNDRAKAATLQTYLDKSGVKLDPNNWLSLPRAFSAAASGQGGIGLPRVPQAGDPTARANRPGATPAAREVQPLFDPDSRRRALIGKIDPALRGTLSDTPQVHYAKKLAELRAGETLKTEEKQQIATVPLTMIDELERKMVEKGPRIVSFSTGPYLGDPGWQKWLSAVRVGTNSDLLREAQGLNTDMEHTVHMVGSAVGALKGGGGGPASDAARAEVMATLGAAFKSGDPTTIFEILHKARRNLQNLAHLPSDAPREAYYPEAWLQPGDKAPAHAPLPKVAPEPGAPLPTGAAPGARLTSQQLKEMPLGAETELQGVPHVKGPNGWVPKAGATPEERERAKERANLSPAERRQLRLQEAQQGQQGAGAPDAQAAATQKAFDADLANLDAVAMARKYSNVRGSLTPQQRLKLYELEQRLTAPRVKGPRG